MTRLAIFDCDGTLVDSGATIRTALCRAFVAHGLEPPPEQVTRRLIGRSLGEVMSELAPKHDHHALSETYKQAFIAMRGSGEVEEPLYDGIVDLLDRMEGDGWQLAVATGKSMRGLRHCLEHHGLHARFVSLQTSDDHPSKPHPSMALSAMIEAGAVPERTVMIGDTAWDMGCARGAGVGAIGVVWGYQDADELTEGGADAIACLPTEVADIAERMTGGA